VGKDAGKIYESFVGLIKGFIANRNRIHLKIILVYYSFLFCGFASIFGGFIALLCFVVLLNFMILRIFFIYLSQVILETPLGLLFFSALGVAWIFVLIAGQKYFLVGLYALAGFFFLLTNSRGGPS